MSSFYALHAHSSLSSLCDCSAAAAADKQRGAKDGVELAQTETGALISDRLTGCVDRAVAQGEEKRRNWGTSCLKTGGKRTREDGRINRAITVETEVIQSRGKEKGG